MFVEPPGDKRGRGEPDSLWEGELGEGKGLRLKECTVLYSRHGFCLSAGKGSS